MCMIWWSGDHDGLTVCVWYDDLGIMVVWSYVYGYDDLGIMMVWSYVYGYDDLGIMMVWSYVYDMMTWGSWWFDHMCIIWWSGDHDAGAIWCVYGDLVIMMLTSYDDVVIMMVVPYVYDRGAHICAFIHVKSHFLRWWWDHMMMVGGSYDDGGIIWGWWWDHMMMMAGSHDDLVIMMLVSCDAFMMTWWSWCWYHMCMMVIMKLVSCDDLVIMMLGSYVYDDCSICVWSTT